MSYSANVHAQRQAQWGMVTLVAAALLGPAYLKHQHTHLHAKSQSAPITKQQAPVNAAWQAHLARQKAQDAAMVAGLKGTLVKTTLPASSLLKDHKVGAWIYLPPGYQQNSSRRYPVIYLMHGAPGSPRDLLVEATVQRVAEDLISKGQLQPCIMVCWDGFGPSGGTDPQYYLDRADGKFQMESFTVKTLVPWVDSHYRTYADPNHRALVGFSAGGFGAANIGLKHPDKWWVMASIAGFFDPDDCPKLMTKLLGPKGSLWKLNSPLERVRELPRGQRLHFYMDCGTDDPLYSEFKKMEKELKERGIDYEAQSSAGDHAWNYVHKQFYEAFRFCDRRWRELNQGK